MLTTEWKTLLNLKPSMFRYPDSIHFSIIHALDRFIGIVGSMPVILSDYRPGDERTHGKGLAIDTTWPGENEVDLWAKAVASGLFNGLGIYLNDRDVVSFHFDKRPGRSPLNPALWGNLISHPYDPETDSHVRRDQYTAASAVLDILKKKTGITPIIIGLSLYAIYRLTRN